ncbi:hypothetical protein AB0M79_32180 [Polymorphospora sp. NPDC051019]|uniref:hypothetical protein n=1 Tax=Polymorphospora sp. NPDC051019 TaxID=3155725 RepID=UPI003436BF43
MSENITDLPVPGQDPDDADVNGHTGADLEVPLLDIGGYLACGCHGSQREHTCQPFD